MRFRSNLSVPASAIACIVLCMVMLGCAAEKERVSLDVPAGDAVKTLKEFARQTEVEIVYDLQSVNGVRTNAVSGSYDPEVALRIMVRGTPLQVDYERETGAYAVFREKS